MSTRRRSLWSVIAGGTWLLYLVFVLAGTGAVPFHPDESTYLYMSRDFDLLFGQGRPEAVTWTAAAATPDVQRYRLLDAPLVRYLAGLGRAVVGFPAPEHDWDWSANWAANARAGAVPEPALLLAARLPMAMLTGLSTLLVFAIGRRLGGPGCGAAAAALYGLNSLVLLHGRRAMSEGPLLCLMLLAFWLLLRAPHRAWLAGISLAAAGAAKLTGLTLLPVAGLALAFPLARGQGQYPALVRRFAVLALSFLLAMLLFHPALWSAPIAGLRAMTEARASLLAEQTAVIREAAPGQVMDSVGQRLLAMLYHAYLAPPAFWDVPNYAADTQPAELAYLAMPLHRWFQSPSIGTNFLSGSLALLLTLLGMALGTRQLIARGTPGLVSSVGIAGPAQAEVVRRGVVLLWAWTLTTVLGLLSFNIAWQRYYLPLVPLACLWSALGLALTWTAIRTAWLQTRWLARGTALPAQRPQH